MDEVLGPNWRKQLHDRLGVLTKSEEHVASTFIRDGWTVMRKGWPDLLVTRGAEVLFCEVKQHQSDPLTVEQKAMGRVLRSLGLSYVKASPVPNGVYLNRKPQV